jgi:hypothetical protein
LTATNTTTTVTTTTSTRSGTQLVVDSQSNTVSIGNVVTDVNIQPYIANRIVSFYAYNLRPNQRLHIFFDSVLVDNYCAPCIIPDTIADTSDYNSLTKNGNWGDPIYSDSHGQVAGQFNIPSATFKTGDRVLEIADVTSISLGNDAITTSASAQFTASNLSVTRESITLTTVNPIISSQNVTQQVVDSQTTTSTINIADRINFTGQFYEPLAQGLTINTPEGEPGIYATSIDIYFQQKSQTSTNGMTVYLCETLNGYPNGYKILPFSVVHLPYDSINVSDDASVLTTFTFEAPVFLNNNTEYAFVCKPDNNDPDYRVYTAILGDIDLTTGYQVFSQPVVGTAFEGATTTQWNALPTEYVKFNLKRANFTTNSGNAVFNNSNTEYLNVYNISYVNTSVGILPGDIIYKASNASPSSVNTSVKGTFNYFDTVRNIFYASNSTGNFTGNSFVQIHRFANSSSVANSTTLIASANVSSLYNPIVDALVPQFASLTPPGTSISYTFKGTSNTYAIDSNAYKIFPGYETEFYDKERIIASKSNEVSSMDSSKSMNITALLKSDSDFLSPIIDTVRKQELVLGNQIDPISFNYKEFFNTSNAKSKYVSKIITLADGQDSQDLQVTIQAHRPYGTAISAYVKFLNGEDNDPISAKTWTPLVNQSGSLYSDPSNPSSYFDFTYVVPEGYVCFTSNGTVTTNTSSAVVTGSNTTFSTTFEPGWYVNIAANSTNIEYARQIISISNNTSMTLNAPFTTDHTNVPILLVVPPTTAYLSTNTSTQLTGTVTTSTTNNNIIGSGTNFLGELTPGSIIKAAGDEQTVVSVSNSTYVTVGKPWSSGVSSANVYIVNPQGLTYLNNANNIYSTFKKFQIKVVLQSNDSSKVPFLKNIRAHALQL